MFVVPRGRADRRVDDQPRQARQEAADAFFEDNLGGAAQAGITVLKPGDRYYGRVLGQSPLVPLTPYFGTDGPVPAGDDAARSARATSSR